MSWVLPGANPRIEGLSSSDVSRKRSQKKQARTRTNGTGRVRSRAEGRLQAGRRPRPDPGGAQGPSALPGCLPPAPPEAAVIGPPAGGLEAPWAAPVLPAGRAAPLPEDSPPSLAVPWVTASPSLVPVCHRTVTTVLSTDVPCRALPLRDGFASARRYPSVLFPLSSTRLTPPPMWQPSRCALCEFVSVLLVRFHRRCFRFHA